MPTPDHKTKDFLEKVEYLISEGIVKNRMEIVTALDWNKSVMSSVMNGALLVPQHIYTKFKEVYKVCLEAKEVPSKDQYRDKYIATLEDQAKELKGHIIELKAQCAKIEPMQKSLDELRRTVLAVGAFQKGYQDYWAEHFPPVGVSPAQVKKAIHNKSLSVLASFDKEGIRP